MLDVVVVGAGIIGLATARELLMRRPDAEVVVIDKATRVAAHQSGHNSGVLHAGVYYRPGSLKARLCVQGKAALERYAADRDIPVLPVGKVVVATDEDELPRLAELERRARTNGVPGLQRLDRSGLATVEPHVRGIAALHSPTTAVTDFGAVCRALAADLGRAGGRLQLATTVTGLVEDHAGVTVVTDRGDLRSRQVVCCGGLQSDRIAAMSGIADGLRVVPFRGTWYLLAPPAAGLVRGNLYPVPDPRYPFLGVHVSPQPDGTVRAGPNAVLAGAREGYRRGTVDVADLAGTLGHGGFWRLAVRNVAAGVRELVHDRSAPAYLRQVQRYLPEVTAHDLLPGPSGVRAQVVAPDGALVDDFVVATTERVVHVRNAPSPAATAALAFADHVVTNVEARRPGGR